MNPMYPKQAKKVSSFDVSIDIEIPVFRVPFTVEPSRFLFTVWYHQSLFDAPFYGLVSN